MASFICHTSINLCGLHCPLEEKTNLIVLSHPKCTVNWFTLTCMFHMSGAPIWWSQPLIWWLLQWMRGVQSHFSLKDLHSLISNLNSMVVNNYPKEVTINLSIDDLQITVVWSQQFRRGPFRNEPNQINSLDHLRI